MCLCALLMTTMTGCKSEEAFNWSQLSAGTASASPAPTVTESSELNVGMPTASGELNPLTNPSASMQGLFKLVFEGVMRLSDRYQPENWLAESVARTEKGYTIMLRAGVLFHDGKGLTAQDVVDSFEAIRDAEASPWKSVIAPITAMTAPAILKMDFRDFISGPPVCFLQYKPVFSPCQPQTRTMKSAFLGFAGAGSCAA